MGGTGDSPSFFPLGWTISTQMVRRWADIQSRLSAIGRRGWQLPSIQVDGTFTTYESMRASDYEESDLLDLGYLSPDEEADDLLLPDGPTQLLASHTTHQLRQLCESILTAPVEPTA